MCTHTQCVRTCVRTCDGWSKSGSKRIWTLMDAMNYLKENNNISQSLYTCNHLSFFQFILLIFHLLLMIVKEHFYSEMFFYCYISFVQSLYCLTLYIYLSQEWHLLNKGRWKEKCYKHLSWGIWKFFWIFIDFIIKIIKVIHLYIEFYNFL